MSLSAPTPHAPRRVSAPGALVGFRVAVALLLALGVAARVAIGDPITLPDVALFLVLAGVGAGLLLLGPYGRYEVPLVLDVGDALIVGRKRHRVPLSEITDFYFDSDLRMPLIKVTSPAYPGRKFSYQPIDLRRTFWGMRRIPAPETFLDLAERIDKATPTPVTRVAGSVRPNG